MTKARRRKVLVSIPTAQHAERKKLEGVLKYAHEKAGERWDLFIDLGDRPRKDLDGVISYVTSAAHRRRILATGLPAVLIEDLCEPKACPRRRNVVTILCDHVAEGQTAARYFLDRHFRNFAFVGTDGEWSRRRGEGFSRTVEKAGFRCRPVGLDGLRALPKPCAVFAAHDILARRVLSAAEELGIAVPHEIAVLGVDDDEVMCTTSAPALSSIPTFDQSVGYAAGRALNEIFARRAKGRMIRTRHAQVITRFSTEKDAVHDPFVARTLEWARQHLADDLGAETLAGRIGYSKHALQSRVERVLGITLAQAIRRLRLTAAEELLQNTTMPIGDIAASCGYTSVSHLSLRIKEAHGLKPLAYRRQFRQTTQTRFSKNASISSSVLPFVSGRTHAAVRK